MPKMTKPYDDWHLPFREINESAEKMISILNILIKWIGDNVVAKDVIPSEMPNEVSDTLALLTKQIRTIKETNDNMRWYFCSQPLRKFLGAEPLTREEFYLLAAIGIVRIPSTTGKEEAYEEFRHFLYEDDKNRGYINPGKKPHPPSFEGPGKVRVDLQIGMRPEDVKVEFLRKEQRDYFENFNPELFSRFRHLKGPNSLEE